MCGSTTSSAFFSTDSVLEGGQLQTKMRAWRFPVVLVATRGGRGLIGLGPHDTEKLADPIGRLLTHPIAADLLVKLPENLVSDHAAHNYLSTRYDPAFVRQLEAAGIGAYMVATDRLWDRLELLGNCPEVWGSTNTSSSSMALERAMTLAR